MLDKAKLAASVLMTAPGVPFIYYGEEIGMTGEKPDEQIRTPMQWSAEGNAGFTTGSPWEPVNGDYRETERRRPGEGPGIAPILLPGSDPSTRRPPGATGGRLYAR